MEEKIRLITAPLSIEYEMIAEQRYDAFKREYDTLSESDDDPVGAWLKQARARGDTAESDQVLITLMVELHRKIDDLARELKNEERVLLALSSHDDILSIGFEHFKTSQTLFEKDKNYYARIEMPLFPKRMVPLFFRAVESNIGKIELLHDRDQKDWNGYVTSRERIMIRELKAKE
jgi:hypothetical protein